MKNNEHPFIKDAYPVRAQYMPGEEVEIEVELAGITSFHTELMLVIDVFMLDKPVTSISEDITCAPRDNCCVTVKADACPAMPGGFGVDITLMAEGRAVDTLSTAYDVALTWTDAPRYGFLCGFGPEDEDDCADVEQLRKYHIVAAQFYDWMYRHHELIPPEDRFIDPLGRQLSLSSVRSKIASCHTYGIKAMAYGAVYTASREFASAHAGMMLFRNDGEQETFAGGWQNIMDVSNGSEWTDHIVGQFKRVVREMDFDGIHMDTYGYPKTSFVKKEGSDKMVRLKDELPRLVDSVKEAITHSRHDACALFNAVGNWPAAEIAKSGADASYIEVWDPASRYVHLRDIIQHAKLIGGKPVILAAYVSAFKQGTNALAENSLLFLQAVIFASGGYHIELGERNAVLCDPYFVEHALIRGTFERTLRNWYDFIVRYRELLYDDLLEDVTMTHAGGINEEYVFGGAECSTCGEPGKVWTIVKERPGMKVIHLINLTGMESDRWNEGKPAPRPVRDVTVRVLDNERAEAVFLASPDRDCCRMQALPFTPVATGRGRAAEFTVPELEYWNMVYIRTEY